MSKQKPSLQNGSQKHHPDSKSIVSLVKREADVDSFFTAKVFFTMHFYPTARLSTKSTVHKRQWEEKGPIHGGEKMDPPPWQHSYTFITYLWLSPKVQDNTHSTNSVLARPCTCRLIFIPEAAIYTEGWCFEFAENIKKNSLMELHALPQTSFQQCFQNCKIAVSGVLGVEWASSKGTSQVTPR